MKIDLSGKTAIVTGSTAGIGFAIAHNLAEAGATVVINGRSDESVADALGWLQDAVPSATARGVAADLGSAEGCAALVAAEPTADILVNNAGIYEPRDFFEIADADWTRLFEVNVMSGVRLARAYLPKMIANNWGRVVFISSESALNIPAEMIHYGSSKTAQLAVSRGLAKRVRGTGVTVNAVVPGPTLSDGFVAMLQDMAQESGKTVDEAAAEFVMTYRPTSIIERPASVDEVAHMVVYACSPQASATTGAALRVDGGVIDTLA